MKGMEAALQSLNVQVQHYHGRAFVGNHVNKSLLVKQNKCNFIFNCN